MKYSFGGAKIDYPVYFKALEKEYAGQIFEIGIQSDNPFIDLGATSKSNSRNLVVQRLRPYVWHSNHR
jgi:hypothetical protein